MGSGNQQQEMVNAEQIRIFVSYRRDDTSGWTSRLCDELRNRFGAESVFQDYESIAAGEDFELRIAEHLKSARAVVIVIGKRWEGNRGWWRRSRIMGKQDWVRKELEIAGEKVPFIFPVLLNNAQLPRQKSLPPSIAYLSKLQTTNLREDRWDDDVDSFIDEIEQILDSPLDNAEIIFESRRLETQKRKKQKRVNVLLFGLALIGIGALLAFQFVYDNEPSNVGLVDKFPVSEANLDVGFWNMKRLIYPKNGISFSRDTIEISSRIERVSSLIIEMDLDIYGLLEVDKEVMDSLVLKLSQEGFTFGYVLQKGDVLFDSALLYRRDRVLCELDDSIYIQHGARLEQVDPATGLKALPRLPLFAKCNSARFNDPILVTVVHFKSMRGDIEETLNRRRLASVIIGEIVNNRKNTIVGGTFHALPEEAMQHFSGLTEVGGLKGLFESDSSVNTFIGSEKFTSMLDYIWLSPDLKVESVNGNAAGVISLDKEEEDYVEYISDHRPIAVGLKPAK